METVNQTQEPSTPLMGKLSTSKVKLVGLVVALLVIGAGIGTGWFLSGASKNGVSGVPKDVAPGAESGASEAGLTDEAIFRDTAEGLLEKGGIEGEGTHHLIREGGPSKYVYLTSTVIDLESFVGKNIQVWGETISARSAGWLMDVGKAKVID